MELSRQRYIEVKVDRNSGFVMHSFRVSAAIRAMSETAFADCDVSLRARVAVSTVL